MGRVSLLSFFIFLFKVALAILGPLHFHLNSSISLVTSVRKSGGNQFGEYYHIYYNMSFVHEYNSFSFIYMFFFLQFFFFFIYMF